MKGGEDNFLAFIEKNHINEFNSIQEYLRNILLQQNQNSSITETDFISALLGYKPNISSIISKYNAKPNIYYTLNHRNLNIGIHSQQDVSQPFIQQHQQHQYIHQSIQPHQQHQFNAINPHYIQAQNPNNIPQRQVVYHQLHANTNPSQNIIYQQHHPSYHHPPNVAFIQPTNSQAINMPPGFIQSNSNKEPPKPQPTNTNNGIKMIDVANNLIKFIEELNKLPSILRKSYNASKKTVKTTSSTEVPKVINKILELINKYKSYFTSFDNFRAYTKEVESKLFGGFGWGFNGMRWTSEVKFRDYLKKFSIFLNKIKISIIYNRNFNKYYNRLKDTVQKYPDKIYYPLKVLLGNEYISELFQQKLINELGILLTSLNHIMKDKSYFLKAWQNQSAKQEIDKKLAPILEEGKTQIMGMGGKNTNKQTSSNKHIPTTKPKQTKAKTSKPAKKPVPKSAPKRPAKK